MTDSIYRLLNHVETDMSIYEDTFLSEYEQKQIIERIHKKIQSGCEKKHRNSILTRVAAVIAVCAVTGGIIAGVRMYRTKGNNTKESEEYTLSEKYYIKEDVTVQEHHNDRRTEEFTDISGDVEIRVDIELAEDTAHMPVVRVEPRKITTEDIDKWKEVFFEGSTAYEKEGFDKYSREYIADDVNGHEAIIGVTNRDEEALKIFSIFFSYNDGNRILDEKPYKNTSEEDARKMADSVLKELGIEDEWYFYDQFSLDGYDNGGAHICEYSIRYVPHGNGISAIPVYANIFSGNCPGNMYHSELEIAIINGIVVGAHMWTPLAEKEILNDDVKMIHIEEAYEIFKEQAKTEFIKERVCDPEDPGYDNMKGYVKINEIKKGLVRIKDKNNENSFLLVPAWVFYGWKDSRYGNTEFPNLDELGAGASPLIIINAIDGSVIDPDRGY